MGMKPRGPRTSFLMKDKMISYSLMILQLWTTTDWLRMPIQMSLELSVVMVYLMKFCCCNTIRHIKMQNYNEPIFEKDYDSSCNIPLFDAMMMKEIMMIVLKM